MAHHHHHHHPGLLSPHQAAAAATAHCFAADSAAANAAMAGLSKPSIAMIRGYCIGGGMAVALTCDMRLCSEDARFAIPAARLGLGYGFDGIKTLGNLDPANAWNIKAGVEGAPMEPEKDFKIGVEIHGSSGIETADVG